MTLHFGPLFVLLSFDTVTVNDANQDLRTNRLRLLSRIRATLGLVADFSKIEG